LCSRCYKRTLPRVRQLETTWAKLESEGLALPVQRKGETWRREWKCVKK
jgi:hypothetical protein